MKIKRAYPDILFLFFVLCSALFNFSCDSPEAGLQEKSVSSSAAVIPGGEIPVQGSVVVDFYADWCGPCRQFAPVFEKTAGDFSGRVAFIKINTDKERALAQKYGIQAIPTIVFIKDGEELDRVMGALDERSFEKKLKQNFGL